MAIKNRLLKKLDILGERSSEKWRSPQIDYPRDGETVGVGHYAIRISAEAGSDVQISFNKVEWLPCRYAVGHWWFDWSPSETKAAPLHARARLANGKWKNSSAVTCSVKRTQA